MQLNVRFLPGYISDYVCTSTPAAQMRSPTSDGVDPKCRRLCVAVGNNVQPIEIQTDPAPRVLRMFAEKTARIRGCGMVTRALTIQPVQGAIRALAGDINASTTTNRVTTPHLRPRQPHPPHPCLVPSLTAPWPPASCTALPENHSCSPRRCSCPPSPAGSVESGG